MVIPVKLSKFISAMDWYESNLIYYFLRLTVKMPNDLYQLLVDSLISQSIIVGAMLVIKLYNDMNAIILFNNNVNEFNQKFLLLICEESEGNLKCEKVEKTKRKKKREKKSFFFFCQ